MPLFLYNKQEIGSFMWKFLLNLQYFGGVQPYEPA